MGKDASTIRQEIEQTRERMGDTVEALAYKTDVPARVKDSVNERLESVKGGIGDVVENVKKTVAGASEDVSEAVDHSARNGGGAMSRTVSDTMQRVNDGLSDRLQNVDVGGTAQRAVGVVQENPIGLALTALAIGFLTGSLLPVSDAERKRLRPIGDKIVDQAQAATSDLVQAGKAVVAETAQTAVASAQSHGQDVVDAAKNRAEHS